MATGIGFGFLAIVLVIFGIVILVSVLVKVAPHEKAVKERLSKYVGVL